jgi:glycosyltransferase involved in cell wall biosynthesis
MPKISIIIPAFNEEKYIEKTIQKIKKSTIKDYEIIVALDSCTDNTEKIVKKLNVKYIKVNARKASAARNAGVKLARGEILVFLDADTLIPKELLEELPETMKTCTIATCKAEPDVKKFLTSLLIKAKDLVISMGLIKTSNGIIITTNKIFNKVGGFPLLPYHEDGVFIRAAAKLGKFTFLSNHIVIQSMRRYIILGYITPLLFWGIEWVKGLFNKRSKIYPAAR